MQQMLEQATSTPNRWPTDREDSC